MLALQREANDVVVFGQSSGKKKDDPKRDGETIN